MTRLSWHVLTSSDIIHTCIYMLSIDALARKISTMPFTDVAAKLIGWPMLDEKRTVCAGGVQTAWMMKRCDTTAEWKPQSLSIINAKEILLENWVAVVTSTTGCKSFKSLTPSIGRTGTDGVSLTFVPHKHAPQLVNEHALNRTVASRLNQFLHDANSIPYKL